MLKIIIVLVVYFVLIFAIVLLERIAIRSAHGLGDWLTLKRLGVAAAISAVLVGLGLGAGLALGWVQLGTPYDSPGFEEAHERPEDSAPEPEPAQAPRIKSKVEGGSIESSDSTHKNKLKSFEGKKDGP